MIPDPFDTNPIDFTKLSIEWILAHGPHIVVILATVIALRAFENFIVTRLIRRFAPPWRASPGEEALQREKTLVRIARQMFNVILWIAAALMIFSEIGINTEPVLAAAGVAAVAVIFGGQSFLRDVIAGLFVILENQYRVGDVICIDKTCGLVEDITLRKVAIRDQDGALHHIAHGAVTKTTNLSKDFGRVNMSLRIAYNADLEDVIRIINETGAAMAADPAFSADTIKPIAFDCIDDFADSAIVVKVLGEFKATKHWGATAEFRKRIKIAFDAAGIRMPYPQQVVHQHGHSA